MSSRWLSAEERRGLNRFLRRYSLVPAYLVARGLMGRRGTRPGSPADLRAQVALNYPATLAIAFWGAGNRRSSPSWFGLSFSQPRRIIFHSAVGAALGAAFMLGPAGRRMHGTRDEWERRIASLSPFEASVLFGLTGLTEEVIWRGWTFSEIDGIFAGRSPRARAAAAIGISTLLFSTVHLANLAQWPQRRVIPELQQMMVAAALGLIAGYWRQTTGSIIPGMVMHDVGNMLRWWTTKTSLEEQVEARAAG